MVFLYTVRRLIYLITLRGVVVQMVQRKHNIIVVQCTVYNVHRTVYSVQCTSYIVQCTV